ncbi:MAG: hypothetical protein Q9214_003239, partial [Letrouitia sp. 1 TL-2023]
MTKADEDHDVTIQFRAPTFREGELPNDPIPQSRTGPEPSSHLGPESQPRSDEDSQRIRDHRRSTGSVHLGSYASSIEIERGPRHGSTRNLQSRNVSQVQLEHLLVNVDAVDSYGLQESRDGFFDATFQSPLRADHEETLQKASHTLPETMRKPHSVSLYHFFPQQFAEAKAFLTDITTTRSGIKLFKSFLGVFVAYVICLVPKSRDWLGRYNYIIVISAILNHPGRPLGSQIDGAMISTLGTAAGLAWGSLALYVSTSTPIAQSGYGGVLASFLILFTTIIAWLRCTLIRLFQAVICAGVAICYTCLADTSQAVGWKKIFNYGIPWVLGQALGLLISILVFPDAGSRSLALSFHQAFLSILKGLDLPRQDASELKRELSYHFVRLSTAVRDFTIDISVSRFDPDDIRVMRNLTQGVIRALLSIQSDTVLFNIQLNPLAEGLHGGKLQDQHQDLSAEDEKHLIVTLVADFLAKPTRKMLDAMSACLDSCDSVMLAIGGQQKLHLNKTPQSLSMCLQMLQKSIEGFDAADDALVDRPEMVSGSSYDEVVKLFLFVHPIRQAADKVRMLTKQIYAMEQKHRGWWLQLPSYPFKKSFNRTNAQVRHDRGGLTAGFYFRTKTQLEKTIEDLHSRSYVPAARHEFSPLQKKSTQAGATTRAAINGKASKVEKRGLRCRIWVALHRLQGFESRFAFKVVAVTTLLSVPAWLDQSRGWWNDNEIWWAVVTVWLMSHPRVSGTFHDLAVRIFYVLLGSVWGALSYRAGSGNPYVVAIFAAVFMIPMLHRYTQSAHPRSGAIGCISFTVVSL